MFSQIVADDVGTLDRVHRLLRPGGVFLMSVPAHPFLWGEHDELNKHERRYRKKELRNKLVGAGFTIERFRYWNVFVFPVACIVRWLGLGKCDSGDVGLGPAWALKIYGWLLAVENWLLCRFALPELSAAQQVAWEWTPMTRHQVAPERIWKERLGTVLASPGR